MDELAGDLVRASIQGLGIGFVYVPLAHRHLRDACRRAMRNEGTALFSLMRNIGSSIGISVVQALFVRNTQIVHASLAQHITPRTLAEQGGRQAASGAEWPHQLCSRP